jgi:pimeloyl-ACP methyl ester carboxylesterase
MPAPGVRAAVALVACGACAFVPALEGEAAPRKKPTPVEVPGSRLPGPGAFEGPVFQVPVNGITIGYRQFGKGPDLLLITGQTGTMSLWPPDFLQALARSFRVTIFDNRGVVYSTNDSSKPLTIELMADDTADLVDALQLGRPAVVGWSMGGEIGLALAVDHPKALSKLVTSGATPGGPKTVPPPPDVEALFASPKPEPTQELAVLFPPTAGDATRRFVEQFGSIPQEEPGVETRTRQAQAEHDFETRDLHVDRRLSKVRIPVLVTNGAEDRGVPPENARYIARRIRGAKLVLFDGAAHGMLFQDQDRFVKLVRDFVRGSGRRT